jgi:transcriptional regulator with XRE-family HTH domain
MAGGNSMDREEFGELIAALREELGWTQAQLAERAGVDTPTVSNVERGNKKHFSADLLSDLAGALNLTRAERKQFFLAASGLDGKEMMRPSNGYSLDQTYDSAQQLEKLIQLVARLRVPCFLVDVYHDVLAANAIIAELFRLPVEGVEELRKIPGGLTVIRLIHGENRLLVATAGEQWESFAINNMRVFRENSLRYRARPYFKYLMKEFRDPKKYPSFQRYWRLASTLGDESESLINEYAYAHPEHGGLNYHVYSSLDTTPHGELYLYQLVPTDEHTTEVFEDLARRSGTRAHRLAPWPEKIMAA